MKVPELIKLLEKQNPELDAYIFDRYYYHEISKCEENTVEYTHDWSPGMGTKRKRKKVLVLWGGVEPDTFEVEEGDEDEEV